MGAVAGAGADGGVRGEVVVSDVLVRARWLSGVRERSRDGCASLRSLYLAFVLSRNADSRFIAGCKMGRRS